MHLEAAVTDSDTLRQQLMAPDPMQRAIALHALELELERAAACSRLSLANEVAKFAARGIPFYALHDPHFCDWVGKAVSYWQKLRGADSVGATRATRRPARPRSRARAA